MVIFCYIKFMKIRYGYGRLWYLWYVYQNAIRTNHHNEVMNKTNLSAL